LAIWGRVTPGAILTKCGLWGDMVDVITCAIFCAIFRKGCGCGVVRRVKLPSPIDLTRRPYNTDRVTTLPLSTVFFQPVELVTTCTLTMLGALDRSSSCRLLRPINCQTYITLHYYRVTVWCFTMRSDKVLRSNSNYKYLFSHSISIGTQLVE